MAIALLTICCPAMVISPPNSPYSCQRHPWFILQPFPKTEAKVEHSGGLRLFW